MTILLTGGGTAGHVLPCVALLPILRKSFDKIYYIGSTNPSEKSMVGGDLSQTGAGKITPHRGVEGVDEFFALECVKLRRTLSPKSVLRNLGIPFGYFKSVRRAKEILRRVKPDIVFSKGGFVALPVVRAAKALGISVVAHESDASLGLANRLSVGACDKVCTTFSGVNKKANAKFVHTGSPIRPQIYRGERAVIEKRHFDGGARKPNLLVLGGSLGAARINAVLVEAAGAGDLKNFNVVHVCGKGKTAQNMATAPDSFAQKTSAKNSNPNFVQIEFATDIENYIAWADVVVSRAGSNTLCELMVLGKPTLFIPLSTGRGDQIENVREVMRFDACGVLFERDLTPATLVRGVEDVFKNRFQFKINAKRAVIDGTQAICDVIVTALRQQAFCRR